MKTLSVKDVELIAFALAKELMSFNEPIPDFSSRFPNILESCVATPFQSFGGRGLYSTLAAKASILFYLLIKNHPFQNGNKRIAITTLLVFLYKNGKWLKVNQQEFYNFTVWVAQSPAQFKDEVAQAIEKFILKNIVPA